MKKIYSIILTAVAVLAFAPAAFAQDYLTIDEYINYKYPGKTITFPNEKPPQFPEGKAFGYSKNISSPFSDGTYYIKLESFALGSGTVEDKPSDIVLVLDVSGSMNTSYTSNVYEPVLSTRAANYQNHGNPYGSFDYNNCGDPNASAANKRYFRFDGRYFEVRRGRVNGNSGAYFLYFIADGTTYYLDHYQVTTTMPTSYNNQYDAWYGGTLYAYIATNATRLRALKEAVVAFIEEIQDNDLYVTIGGQKIRRTDKNGNPTSLGNRVSIVKYAGNIYNSSNYLAEGNHRYSTNGQYNNTELLKNYEYVDDAGVFDLIKAVAGLSQGGTTAVDWGLDIANAVLAQPQPVQGRESNKTLVMFTDGSPTHNNNFEDAVANAAIYNANTSKTTHKAKVFAVGILTNDGGNVGIYMNRVSSNYENATSLTNSEARKVSDIYYKNVSSGGLKDVFKAIAKQSGGSGTSLSASTSNVDIVSNSFILPSGVTSTNIANYVKVFTAPLTYCDTETNTYTFGTETLAGYATDTYDVFDDDGNITGTYKVDEVPNPSGTGTLGISVALESGNTIKVTNFDYSNNWCGPLEDQTHQITYHGHKIIILIPIQMNPDAVGGPNVATNADGSGIFTSPTESYVTFESPTVSLPVNIYIEKTGLTGVESAKFIIERAFIPNKENWTIDDIDDDDWEYVTSVFVTNSPNSKQTDDGNPMTRVRGLPATKSDNGTQRGLVYRVTEQNWSWSYDADTPPQYTNTQHMENPFTFSNSKPDPQIDNVIKHSESKVTNVFKRGVENKVYDDYKANDRSSSTNTNPTD